MNGIDTVQPVPRSCMAVPVHPGRYATFARDVLKAKSAALVYPEGAGTDIPAARQASAFQAGGIPIKVVSYPAERGGSDRSAAAADAQTPTS